MPFELFIVNLPALRASLLKLGVKSFLQFRFFSSTVALALGRATGAFRGINNLLFIEYPALQSLTVDFELLADSSNLSLLDRYKNILEY